MTFDSKARAHSNAGASDRSFGLVMAVFFAAVSLWPLLGGGAVRFWSLLVSISFLLFAVLNPTVLSRLNALWAKFGELLHGIVSPIALMIVFFVSVLPIAIVYRLLRKDPLRLKASATSTTYWISRDPPGPDPKTLIRQF